MVGGACLELTLSCCDRSALAFIDPLPERAHATPPPHEEWGEGRALMKKNGGGGACLELTLRCCNRTALACT